jgi:hypothetical protein
MIVLNDGRIGYEKRWLSKEDVEAIAKETAFEKV